MNYTINYHLPQWEESDRVLMTDFNQMCRDMEAGLGRAENARVQALAEQWERVLDRITPLGCDLYHALLRSEPEADYASHWGRIRYFPFASNQEVYDRTG